jgi:hypothetical protein
MPPIHAIARTAVLATLATVAGCAAIPSKHIHTEIDIAAPPEKVWTILADNTRYPEWNPYHVRVEGTLAVGSRLDVELHKPNGERVHIEPHVIRLTPDEELTWGGGIKGIFFGEHVFLLEPGERAGTRLVQKETFSGIAVPFVPLDAIEEGYNLMNRALKARAEAVGS